MKKAIFKLKLRTDRKNVDGSNSIFIYFKERGEYRGRIISTHFKCNINDWSQKDQEYKQNVKDCYPLNKQINSLKKTCNNIIENYYIANKLLTFEKFKQELYFKDQPCDNVFDYIQTVIHRKKGTIKLASLRNYDLFYNKLLIMYPDRDLFFYDINYDFIQRLDKYLQEHNNNKNTTCRKHKTFQVIVNHALKDGLLKSDPYQFFSKGTIKGERQPLTEFDLKKLIEVYKIGSLPEPEQKALKMFLFMCFTGLRISDLLTLKYKNIISEFDSKGNPVKMIEISQTKTQRKTTIPIIFDMLSTFMDGDGHPEDFICREYQNGQNINYQMKLIAKKAGINNKLSCHIARHTFATFALNNGVSLNTVSQILGHTNVNTTQIYAKLLNRSKIDEMQKLKGVFDM